MTMLRDEKSLRVYSSTNQFFSIAYVKVYAELSNLKVAEQTWTVYFVVFFWRLEGDCLEYVCGFTRVEKMMTSQPVIPRNSLESGRGIEKRAIPLSISAISPSLSVNKVLLRRDFPGQVHWSRNRVMSRLCTNPAMA